MVDIGLTTKELARLLVKHGEEFVCCKEQAGVSPLECGVPQRRMTSSGAALRKQIDCGDFRVIVSFNRYASPANEKGMWWVSLKAKFGTCSPSGSRRVDLTYDVVGPTPAQVLVLHEREKLMLASDVKGLPPEQTLQTRTDIL